MENHLFISYAHVDNQETPEKAGWITRFHKTLEAYLSTNIGEEAKIWRDEKLGGNDLFDPKIVKQFPQTAVLVSVLSERYFNSEWCIKEVNEFCRVVEENEPPGLIIEDKARVFKVMLKPREQLPEPSEPVPDILKDTLGYPFYEEVQGERTLPLDPALGTGEAYRRQIYLLAGDVAELVKKIEDKEKNGVDPGASAAPSKPSIYLAECSSDRKEDREKIRAALKDRYVILPDQDLPRSEKKYIVEVERLLDECILSIHLIGTDYGWAPDGPLNKSCVVLQNQIAVKKSKASGLPRVIWLPQGIEGRDDRQKTFIKALHEDSEVQFGADLTTESLEKVKITIHDTLKKLDNAEAHQSPADRPKMVYLLCSKKDRKATIPVSKYLREKGLEVERPTFSGDPAEVDAANKALMKTCDAVLLFWGDEDEAWKSRQESDLRAIEPLRESPLQAIYTYLAEPATEDKEFAVEDEEPNLINGLEGFTETEIDAFVKALSP